MAKTNKPEPELLAKQEKNDLLLTFAHPVRKIEQAGHRDGQRGEMAEFLILRD